MRNSKFILLLGFLAVLVMLTLNGCGNGNGPLLSNVQLTPLNAQLTPGINANPLNIDYDIGQDSHIDLTLLGPNAQIYILRQNEPRTPGHYSLQFNGIVTVMENNLPQQRLLPSGSYQYTLKATADNGQVATPQSGSFTVTGGNSSQPLPLISNLKANPAVISPNFDAIDDVTSLNWQVSQPASVTVTVSGPQGVVRVLKKPTKIEPAQAAQVAFDGLDIKQVPLPDGVYTYTVQAADPYGNISQAASTITIKGGGLPYASISNVTFSPQQITKGGEITVTLTVINTGKVPIRTQGPDSGYTYDSRDTYRSIEGGQFDYKAGFWRVGVKTDNEDNYPYRWGFGHDLQPGEQVNIVGHIKVNENNTKLTFSAGLLQEQVHNWADNINPTTVTISP